MTSVIIHYRANEQDTVLSDFLMNQVGLRFKRETD